VISNFQLGDPLIRDAPVNIKRAPTVIEPTALIIQVVFAAVSGAQLVYRAPVSNAGARLGCEVPALSASYTRFTILELSLR